MSKLLELWQIAFIPNETLYNPELIICHSMWRQGWYTGFPNNFPHKNTQAAGTITSTYDKEDSFLKHIFFPIYMRSRNSSDTNCFRQMFITHLQYKKKTIVSGLNSTTLHYCDIQSQFSLSPISTITTNFNLKYYKSSLYWGEMKIKILFFTKSAK